MTYFISPRDLQRSSRKILEDINKSKKAAIILSKKKPVGVIITYKLFSKMKATIYLEKILQEAQEESRKGKVRTISTAKELDAYFKELEKAAK